MVFNRKTLKIQLNKVFTGEYIYIYTLFFLFFMIYQIEDLGSKLFLGEKNQLFILAALQVFGALTLVFLPLIIIKLNSKYGNLKLAKISLILFAPIGLLMIFFPIFTYFYLFVFPVVARFFNNSLNPYIIKKSSETENTSTIFAFRDFFFYLGISLSSFLSSYLRRIGESYYQIFDYSAFILLVLIIFLLLFKTSNGSNNSAVKVENKLEKKQESTTNKPKKEINITRFRNLSNKKNLIIFILISSLAFWIVSTITYIPIILDKIGYNSSSIFEFYAFGYLIVAVGSIFISLIASNSANRKIYLLDLIIDVIPLSLILFLTKSYYLIIFAVILLLARDFVSPFSLSYIFSCFKKNESDYIWGILASIPSIFSIIFLGIIPILVSINWMIPVLVSIIVAIIDFFIAFIILPKTNKNREPKTNF